ncbi:hypothetical protein MHYP_G00141820 [Metynnis hypsauchen]
MGEGQGVRGDGLKGEKVTAFKGKIDETVLLTSTELTRSSPGPVLPCCYTSLPTDDAKLIIRWWSCFASWEQPRPERAAINHTD